MNPTLTVLQEKFVELMLDGKYYTNKQMAEILDCDERTIYKMKQNPKVAKAIEEKADNNLKTDISRAYNVLTDILFNPETSDKDRIKALDLYLKTQGKLKDKAEVDTNVKVSSVEQAEAELDKLLEM